MEKFTTKKILGIIAAAIVMFAIAQNFGSTLDFLGTAFSVLAPLIVGGCIAFIINVPMSFFEELFLKKCKFSKNKFLTALARPLALIISILLLGAVLIILIVIIIPEIASTILTISNNFPTYIQNIIAWTKSLYDQYPQIAQILQGIQIDWTEVSATGLQIIKITAETIVGSTIAIAGNLIGGMVSFFLSFVLSIYILFQKEKISRHAVRALNAFLSEKKVAVVMKIARLTFSTFSRFLSGQCIEACILGCLVFIAMSIFNFPFAIMISVLIAVFSFIPMFGVYIACGFGALLMILQGDPLQAVLFFLMFVVIQQMEGNLIYPHVVGGSVGLSPIIVLSAIVVGGGFFGLTGMLISVPLSAVLCALYKDFVTNRLQKKADNKISEQQQQDIGEQQGVSD